MAIFLKFTLMFGKLFNDKPKKEKKRQALTLKPLDYPPKIILAWGEAVSGNSKIRDWLGQNGYKELNLFCFALNNVDAPREWLMKNGFPHLAAMINGGEGNEDAITWLENQNLPILAKMALAIDNDIPAMQWLINNHRDFAILAAKMQTVKNNIEERNGDMHKRG